MISKPSVFNVFFSALFLICAFSLPLSAQDAAPAATAQTQQAPKKASSRFEAKVRVADSSTLIAGKTKINLWGVEGIEYMPATFKLRAQSTLDNAIGGQQVQCELKSRAEGEVNAQCANIKDMDLGLYMLQQGLVSVDRSVIFGTVFEEAYIQAENEAQARGAGIWVEETKQQNISPAGASGSLMLNFGFILFLCIIVAFSALSIIIMRGFQKVIDAQKQNFDFLSKERRLKEKEREVVAMMLDSELKANKSKIEAYIVVYDEMLKALKDPERPPKYKKSGDIVQKQPALDRAVFDRNTDKIDTLGERLASELIHFYARIKTKSDYENLEPDMDLPQAIDLVEKAVKNAQRLDDIAQKLINAFNDGGMSAN